MQPAPIPPHESQRLRELYSYEALDTATEKALDDIAQTAAAICGTPFGAISLIDLDRQWFKAQFGFSLKETVRSHSICGHGILHDAFFEVPDTEADPRFQDNGVLKSLGVRFYGGTQLIGANGNVLGMLCVLDPEPRQLSEYQRTQLTTLSIKAMELLEAHRLRHRMEWLGALVNQAPDETCLFDFTTLLLVHANDAARGYLAADQGAVSLEGFASELAAAEFESQVRLLKSGATEVVFETWVSRAAGRIPVEVRWQRLAAAGHTLVMCTLRDIRQRLALDQAKSDFISVVSHELRTPLTGLYGAIKLLDSGVCGELSPATANMVSLASRAADDLLALVNDILDLEKTTVGLMAFDMAPIAIGPLFDDLILAHKDMAAQAGVALINAAPAPVWVMADARRLRQVLVNLLSNALKFAPATSTITLNAFAQAGGAVRITVTDQGLGVPEDFKPRLFERFSQADTTTTRTQTGSGLGLSIVKSMAEAMGGSVACVSQPGCTEFRVDLPQAQQVFQ